MIEDDEDLPDFRDKFDLPVYGDEWVMLLDFKNSDYCPRGTTGQELRRLIKKLNLETRIVSNKKRTIKRIVVKQDDLIIIQEALLNE